LIHRDLKPSNIFVLDDDAVKVIDFGVVHLAGANSATTVKGTLQYMAPEQINLQPCTPASDIYSLGVVCYEALTGRKPFARKTEAETAEAVRSYIPPPICEMNPLVSQVVTRHAIGIPRRAKERSDLPRPDRRRDRGNRGQ
jgi:serine/threonine-protein kinase